LVDRVQRIAFYLDDSAFFILGQDSATGGALPARGGIPGGFAGDHVFRGLNIGEKILFGPGVAARCESEAPDSEDLDEMSPT